MNWDWIYRDERRVLDSATRAGADGSFVNLPDGCTHYQLGGPELADPVVLVHGFSVPYFIWDPTFDALTAAGCRVLRYDQFGRGYSDRPNTRYNIELFVRQLHDLLDTLGLRKVDLIGLSMGGAVSSAFTVEYPECVRTLVLIDPIGTEPYRPNLIYRLALIPGVSELLLSMVSTQSIVDAFARDFFDPAEVERYREPYRAQVQFKGFRRAILSTVRNKVVDGFPAVYERLGKLEIPVMLIWGKEDRTLPIAQSESIRRLVPRVDFRAIENAGHVPHAEQPGIVHPMILEFLNSND